MKINCLSCGHNIDLDDAYAENYDGPIKCFACSSTLELRTEQSAIRRVRLPDQSVVLAASQPQRNIGNGRAAD